MGVSVSRLYSALTSLSFWGKDKEVRILMVGLDSAGKVSSRALPGPGFLGIASGRNALRIQGGKTGERSMILTVLKLIMIMYLVDMRRPPSYTDYKSEK
jgi:hypothetical protein